MNKEEFYKSLTDINININEEQKKQFEIYYNYLFEYNKQINITAITNKEEVYLKHFYDSALLSQSIEMNDIHNMLDIGCGAGFPGLVIKILYPQIFLTLLDSNNKKTKFCSILVEKLMLENVEIINDRAENFIINRREYYDLVTARAVKNLNILNELAIPFVKINGKFIAMKSNYEEELDKSLKGINILGGRYVETKNINLPNTSGIRNFIIITKQNKTDYKYPRKYNKILNQPL